MAIFSIFLVIPDHCFIIIYIDSQEAIDGYYKLFCDLHLIITRRFFYKIEKPWIMESY